MDVDINSIILLLLQTKTKVLNEKPGFKPGKMLLFDKNIELNSPEGQEENIE
jgi:hypothetical protein